MRLLPCLLLAPSLFFNAITSAHTAQDAVIARVENGLLPEVRVKGEARTMTLAERMEFYKIPGVSIAVINDGKLEWARGYGVKQSGSNEAITTETLFEAGSISKPVAAVAVLKLVEQGKLTLDENINNKLTSWKLPDNQFTAQKKVNLRQLLSHSAGLNVHGFEGYAAGQAVPSLAQILDGISPSNSPAVRVEATPGSGWRYSGGGYTIVQQALEDVSHTTFPQVMQKNVFQPLGMTYSTYEQPLPKKLEPRAATAHVNGAPVRGKWHTYPEQAAAGLWTTPSDLAKLLITLQQSLGGKTEQLLAPATLREMMTIQSGNYGLGFAINGDGAAQRFSHGGVDMGFEAYAVAYNSRGQGAVIMTNGNQGISLANEIANAIAQEYQWPDYLPAEKIIFPMTTIQLDQYTGNYQLGNNMLVKVVREGKRLFGEPQGQPRIEIFPQAENEFFVKEKPMVVSFRRDAEGKVNAFVLDNNEAMLAKKINSELANKAKSQQPTPGSEDALRKLIIVLGSESPDLSIMSEDMAKITKEQWPGLHAGAIALGAVQSVKFNGISDEGWDLYEVKHQNGFTDWRILVADDGIITGALVTKKP